MFDVGFWELALCFVIALVVLGPERLPRLARSVGTWVGRARAFVRHVSAELEQEMQVEEWRQEAKRMRDEAVRAGRGFTEEAATGEPTSEEANKGAEAEDPSGGRSSATADDSESTMETTSSAESKQPVDS